MSRLAIVLLLACAALAQASVPANDAGKVILRQHRVASVLQPKLKGQFLCKECEAAFNILKTIADNPKVEQEVRDTLTAVCNMPMFSAFKDQCLNLVNDVIVVIHDIQGLLDDPDKICDAFKLCDAAPSVASISKRLFLTFAGKFVKDAAKPASVNIDDCKLCVDSLTGIEKLFGNKKIVDLMEEGIEEICKYVGDDAQQKECKTIIDFIFPRLVRIIERLVKNPEKDCEGMGACPSTSPTPASVFHAPVSHPQLDRLMSNINAAQRAVGVDVGCLTCETAVKAALVFLSTDSVENTITKDVTNIACDKVLPKSLEAGCLDFMNIYFKAAVQLTLVEWTPAQICTAVKACQAPTLQQLLHMPEADKSKAMCTFCKSASKMIADDLQKPAVQQEIITLLTKVCLKLPGDAGNKCGDMVVEFVPFALGWVADFFSRSDVCSVLHLC